MPTTSNPTGEPNDVADDTETGEIPVVTAVADGLSHPRERTAAAVDRGNLNEPIELVPAPLPLPELGLKWADAREAHAKMVAKARPDALGSGIGWFLLGVLVPIDAAVFLTVIFGALQLSSPVMVALATVPVATTLFLLGVGYFMGDDDLLDDPERSVWIPADLARHRDRLHTALDAADAHAGTGGRRRQLGVAAVRAGMERIVAETVTQLREGRIDHSLLMRIHAAKVLADESEVYELVLRAEAAAAKRPAAPKVISSEITTLRSLI